MRTALPSFPGVERRRIFGLPSWLFMTAPLLLAGCHVVGGSGPGPSSPEATGATDPTDPTDPGFSQGMVYQGFIEIEGGRVTAALEIVRRGRREVSGALQTGSGLMAEGEGRLSGQTLTLELVYGGTCPGRMSLEGEWDQDSGSYEGVVEATDCTGKGGGFFRFSAS
ncbi:MAG: hypothetical protein MUO50_09955 [Longimicrobiales bacterium]|nr:hypothetical protein [Longimicrobiales bacterium]